MLFDAKDSALIERGRRFARDALGEHLWEAARLPDVVFDLEAHVSGNYAFYRDRAKRFANSSESATT